MRKNHSIYNKMDRTRRVYKVSSPQQGSSATSSTWVSYAPQTEPTTSASTSSATKFTIEQKVTPGAAKKGPYSVKRSVDPNEVVIKRRIGEGSKPIFSRGDICVNPSVSPKKKSVSTSSSTSDSSSSNDRYRRKSPSPRATRKPEKVPYFLDQKRENDRIKRVYGDKRRSRSLSNERRRRTIRSRSKTPPSYQRRYRSYTQRRSSSRDRHRSYNHTHYSRSRSRSRERRREIRNRRKDPEDERQPQPPATQYIPIPVPVEYPFIPHAWGAPMIPPQARFPFLLRPTIPAMPYMPRHFRPSRFISNAYQRGNFRPRQY